ncbi:MAG: tRNA pseudouridine(55) synthase TruB [Deltaproteobacteria bacterium]|nr:tRNA pseudouridine(55) synthase TruB [Deltaproteobacteria bacterium]
MSGSRRWEPQLDGLLVLNKPSGPTSTDCLNTLKRRFGQKKIGHAGTLDPLAAGVLLVLFGQATKMASYLTEEKKTYAGVMVLGLETDSYDIQGRVLEERPWQDVHEDMVHSEIRAWQDLEDQEVPPVSAAKYKGRPLYALQRAGLDVPVKIKRIRIHQAEVIGVDLPRVRFRVTCSQGTYVRSLVHSLGKRLGVGAVLTELVREACHPYGLAQARSLDEVLEHDKDALGSLLIPLSEVLPHWKTTRLDQAQTLAIRQGVRLPADSEGIKANEPGERRLFHASDGSPIAMVEAVLQENRTRWSILRGLWSDEEPAQKTE